MCNDCELTEESLLRAVIYDKGHKAKEWQDFKKEFDEIKELIMSKNVPNRKPLIISFVDPGQAYKDHGFEFQNKNDFKVKLIIEKVGL